MLNHICANRTCVNGELPVFAHKLVCPSCYFYAVVFNSVVFVGLPQHAATLLLVLCTGKFLLVDAVQMPSILPGSELPVSQ